MVAKVCHTLLEFSSQRYVSNDASSRCGNALNALNVKRSPEKRNSVQEQFRDIQATRNVSCADKFKARCMPMAIGPPEQETTEHSPCLAPEMICESPRFTRAVNSSHDSTPGITSSPATHISIIASTIFWKFFERSSGGLVLRY